MFENYKSLREFGEEEAKCMDLVSEHYHYFAFLTLLSQNIVFKDIYNSIIECAATVEKLNKNCRFNKKYIDKVLEDFKKRDLSLAIYVHQDMITRQDVLKNFLGRDDIKALKHIVLSLKLIDFLITAQNMIEEKEKEETTK